MPKTIFKEICMMLMLCLAILIVLGIILYQYVPTNKLIPNKVTAYTTPEEVKAEIDEETTESYTADTQVYEITDSDLRIYEQNKSYNPGKPNPFATYSEQTNPTGNTSTTNPDDKKSDSEVKNTTTNPDDTNHFYNTTGKTTGTK